MSISKSDLLNLNEDDKNDPKDNEKCDSNVEDDFTGWTISGYKG